MESIQAPGMIQRRRRGFRRPASDPEATARKKLKFKHPAALLDAVLVEFLMPNGLALNAMEITSSMFQDVDELLGHVKEKYEDDAEIDGAAGVRGIDWRRKMWIEDESGHKIEDIQQLFSESTERRLLVQDGDKRTVHRVLWNVTPAVEMLERLPDGYTLETALADHVDNALQAVWENQPGCRRLVSVKIDEDTITIFDTGMGMDGTAQNSIEKWGTVGASNNRNVHCQGIGGNPPFLKPYLGKYGAGGVAAALFLGLSVEVRSKTRQSKRVVSLNFSKAAMETGEGSRIWKTRGGFHSMTEDETRKSPHKSFSCVKISELKSSACIEGHRQYWVLKQVKQMLKDIYSLYIQYDGVGSSSRTMTPVEFEVNGENLLEELGGEITICNQHSCPGEPFILDLHFSAPLGEANARLTCQYFPSIKGREKLSEVLEELQSCRKDFKETFDTSPRVGVRWLGRLLPNARWNSISFMDAAAKKSVPRWIRRVKVFADVDAGFHPTPTKTKLVEDHPFTTALKQLGSLDEATVTTDVNTTICFQGKVLEASQLIAEFVNWTKRMHEDFDREAEFGDDPTYVIGQSELKKLLKVEKEVLCFHKCLKDLRGDWKSGDMIRLQKELYKGKQNFYGVIEWFFCDGVDEQHGEVKMVCRPVELLISEEESKIETAQICSFKLNRSKWFPCSYLTSDKCHRMTLEEWLAQEKRLKGKLPASIELLNEDDRRVFGEKRLSRSQLTFEAGSVLPFDSFLVVVRPQHSTGATCKQPAIVADPHRMKAEVLFSSKDHVGETTTHGCYYSGVESRNGVKGIYTFSARKVCPDFCKAGKYRFEFSIDGHPQLKPAVWEVNIKALESVSRWHFDAEDGCTAITLEELVTQSFTIQGFDIYGNVVPFSQPWTSFFMVLETLEGARLSSISFGRESVSVSQRKDKITVKNFTVRGCVLPACNAILCLYVEIEKLGHWRCQVNPGKLSRLELVNSALEITSSGSLYCVKQPLDPDNYLPCMEFKGFDHWGNSVRRGTRLRLKLTGVHLSRQEVETDGAGIIRFRELKVANKYNSAGSIVLLSEEGNVMFELSFKIASRTLRFASELPKRSFIGREIAGLTVEVVDEAGNLDAAIGGTLAMSWDDNICFNVKKGQCHLRLTMPTTPGLWQGRVWHYSYPNMSLSFEIQVELAAACNLVCEEQANGAGGCGEEIALEFEARDEFNLPGFLSDEIIDQMEVEVIPEEDYPTEESVLLSKRISTDDMKYSLRIVLDGKEGFYVVTLKHATHKLSWSVYLGCGDVHRLVPFCGKREELLKALMAGDRHFSVSRRGVFPELQVCLVDHMDNVCHSIHAVEEISLMITAPDTQQAIKRTACVADGFAAFQSFTVDMPLGVYDIVITASSKQVSVPLEVTPGNNPTLLRLLDESPCELTLSDRDDEQQVVPAMRVRVECEDGRPLQALQQLTLSVWDPLGENYFTKSGERHSKASVYAFEGVVVPPRAGPYVLKFVLEGSDEVTPIKFQLDVVHGRPHRLKFNVEQEHSNTVVVDVVDVHGNRCERCQDIPLKGKLSMQRSSNSSVYCVTARDGQATFSDLEIMPELFSFDVCVAGGEFNNVKSAMSRLVVLRGNYSRQQVENHLYEYIVTQSSTSIKSIGTGIKQCHKGLDEISKRVPDTQESLSSNTAKLRKAEASLSDIYDRRQAAKDDEVLLRERNEAQRSEIDVLNELKTLVHKESSAALAQYKAQEMKPRGFPWDDILGPIVLLARVEKDEINRSLSNFLGARSLLQVVCKTDKGIRWLRSSDANGNVDNSAAFLAFVRAHKLWAPENFYAFRVDAIKQYKRDDGNVAVDARHPQKLLNIPPPVLPNSEIPDGFLGYGVNFLYLRPEHLELRQSLFYHVFRKLQVYDTEENMMNAWNKMSSSCQAVSLDGGRCEKGQVLVGSRRTSEVPSVRFASVPYGEREQCSLVPAAALAFAREKELSQWQATVEELRVAASNDEKKLQELQDGRQRLEKMIENFQRYIPPENRDDFCKQMLALQELPPEDGGEGTLQIYVEETFEERRISSRDHMLLQI